MIVQLKIYLLLHQAQFGSMENYTKVKLDFELFSYQKFKRFWNYCVSTKKSSGNVCFYFSLKQCWNLFHLSYLLKSFEFGPVCTFLPPVPIFYIYTEGQLLFAPRKGQWHRFLKFTAEIYFPLFISSYLQHNSFWKLKSFLVFFKNGHLEKMAPNVFNLQF